MKNFKVDKLYFVSIVMMILFVCCGRHQSKGEKDSGNYGDFKFGVHPLILYVLKNYSKEENEGTSVRLKSINEKKYCSESLHLSNSIDHIYMVMKFFTMNKEVCFSLWQSTIYPEFIKSPEGIVRINKDSAYYFEIGKIKLIIIDSVVNNPYYIRTDSSRLSNIKAIFNENIEIMTDKDPIYKSYRISNNRLIRINEIVPDKYDSEILIDFEEDSEILEFFH